jgi:hypothetical protein
MARVLDQKELCFWLFNDNRYAVMPIKLDSKNTHTIVYQSTKK